jgi:hypothetical protein
MYDQIKAAISAGADEKAAHDGVPAAGPLQIIAAANDASALVLAARDELLNISRGAPALAPAAEPEIVDIAPIGAPAPETPAPVEPAISVETTAPVEGDKQ